LHGGRLDYITHEKYHIKELARELKLSVSTISKALHDSHEISEKTKRRVMENGSKAQLCS
jgi:LacI family transcriptional regulator